MLNDMFLSSYMINLINNKILLVINVHTIQPPRGIAGSTLLKLIDRFALNNHNLSHPTTNLDNIGMINEGLHIYNNIIIIYVLRCMTGMDPTVCKNITGKIKG